MSPFPLGVLASARVASAPAGDPYPDEVLADSPLVYWRMSDTTMTMVDAAGSSRNGSHRSVGVAYSQGSLLGDGDGSSVTYTSSNGNATMAYGPWMNTATLTVEARVKILSLSKTVFVLARWPNGASSQSTFLFQVLTSGLLHIQVFIGSTEYALSAASGALTVGNTYTLGFTHDASNLSLYSNGVQVGTRTLTGNLNMPAAGGIEVNRAVGTNSLSADVQMAEVSYTPTGLSAARMAARHAAAIAT